MKTVFTSIVLPFPSRLHPESHIDPLLENGNNLKMLGFLWVILPSESRKGISTAGRTGEEKSLAFCNPYGEDINGDGLMGLICHFRTETAGFLCGDTEGFLKGIKMNGISIEGWDLVLDK